MYWVILALILIIFGYVIYNRKKSTAQLSPEKIKDLTAEQMKVIDKEIARLSQQGGRLSIPILLKNFEESKAEHCGDQRIIAVIDNTKQEIIKKYGSYIHPEDAFYENGEMIAWNEHPGCFERHLQRRYKNVLFPPDRRCISKKDIEEAREKDKMEQEYFFKKVSELGSQMRSLGEIPIGQLPTHLQNIQSLIEEAASIGGEALNQIPNLEKIEDNWSLQLESALPENKHDFETIKSLAVTARNPYMAQRKRKDTPILKEEEVPTLLSEDLATISGFGLISRSFAPNFRPNETDIKKHLDDAINQGFSKDRAREIMDAWNYNR